ncbi:MAG: cysteine-rich CWC family protein [Candidatus Acidiferrales bacterium]
MHNIAVAKRKVCPSCGETFECAAPEAGCWCESVALDHQALTALRECYSDCLCPGCLAKQASVPRD